MTAQRQPQLNVDENAKLLSLLLFDTHAHPQDSRNALASLQSHTGRVVNHIALQSVDERDWHRVAALNRSLPHLCSRAGFGIHPWFAPALATDADRHAVLLRLRRLLERRRDAFVGEIGLDKVAVYAPSGMVEFERQIAVFQAQFQLAGELKRPVSVHVVHAHGHMLDAIALAAKSGSLPSAIALHSFSGKAPAVQQYLRAAGKTYDRLFFGFSSVICMRAEQRTREAIAAVPDDRLLLETDINDGAQIESLMNDIAQVVMDVKQWTRSELAEITNANAQRFFESLDVVESDEQQAVDDLDANDNDNDNSDNDKNSGSQFQCCDSTATAD
jgi:TatD DNase family protein